MKKRFLTLFPNAQNIHLTKDVGMIPFIMHKYYGYEATIACYNNEHYPALNDEVKGLKMVFIKKIFYNQFLDSIWFIICNAKKYEVLQMFHWVLPHQVCCLLFKFLKSGKSCIYIKLDADIKIKNTKGIKLNIIQKTLSYFDIVSVESKDLYQFFKTTTKLKIEYIPNGFYDYGKKRLVQFDEKENIILTVGRIGTEQKGTNILLEGYKMFAINNNEWKLKVVGSIESSFEAEINVFFDQNPTLKERIEFVGAVSDKIVLNKIYQSAKIFALTSRWESFGLVYVEALQAGCYIISTDILSAYDVTDNQKFGILFPIDNAQAFASCIKKAVNEERYLKENCIKAQEFGYENFYWPKILSKIDILINKKLS